MLVPALTNRLSACNPVKPDSPSSMYQVLAANFSFRWTALVLVEHVLIVLSVVFAAVAPLGMPETVVAASQLLWRAMLIAFVLQICLHYCDLYDLRTLSDRRDLITGLLRALGQRLADPRLPVFLDAVADHRPRRVRRGVGPDHRARGRLAHRVRMDLASRRTGRAAADRRHERGSPHAGARAVLSPRRARRGAGRVRRYRSGQRRDASDQSRCHRHYRRHSSHRPRPPGRSRGRQPR